MTFGFGFGLPHHVAILGGETYYLSMTSKASSTLAPYTISVDSSNNAVVFGQYSTYGLGFKLDSGGTLSISENTSTAGSYSQQYLAVSDGSDGYYAIGNRNIGCGYTYFEVLKLDSSLAKVGNGLDIQGGTSTLIPQSAPIIDSSGNVWYVLYDYNNYGAFLIKNNSALTTTSRWGLAGYSSSGYDEIYYTGIAVDSAGNLIGAGAESIFTCCVYYTHSVLQSVSTSNPTAQNWLKFDPSGTYGAFETVAVDSSNNVYTSIGATVFKFNSSGVIQWGYSFTNIQSIKSIVIDSSGYLYCIGRDIFGALVIIKLNSNGVFDVNCWSGGGTRTLTPTTGALNNINQSSAVVKGSSLYVTVKYGANNSALVFKVPTDGSLTQSLSVGGYSFTYAAGSTTSSVATNTFTSVSYPLTALSALTTGSSPTTLSALTVSNAVDGL